ncbi:MAG: ADP-ribosylglycohydrolase family protein [Kiritimatiellia bacterium]|jgi:ADP-ribosylglycohydrolase|nr:ADP-ribosylglycohydrolase family protein [Kiritimatiellia bacterium]MDP6809293.1 ADP-ribosylglycohydrolase family protein [Kiritimatiellia bacterium]MDP7023031.1 ADP-ribosylglycohydrolase family protein [Kiritimatiellia bacterium]
MKHYPKIPEYGKLIDHLKLQAQLKAEYGAKGISQPLAKAERALKDAVRELQALPIDETLAKREPNDLAKIKSLRPTGIRRIWETFDRAAYGDRLEGALLGRMAGCTLGAPVEFWPIVKMRELAEENGDAFPPTDYWSRVPDPKQKRYQMSKREAYTQSCMKGVPVDDDIIFTLLGLLIAEDHGPTFTVDDVGRAWVKYLPYACTAEEVALNNLKKGVSARLAGERDNPYCEWIGADIRADPWGYMAPGWPERAAEMAYTDAYISHRRQGIYGEMFFAAAIAAAFAVDDPVEALRIGLSEIPKNCALAKAMRWALRVSPDIRDYKQARAAMDKKFKGMHAVHTINNACLTIWGITIGGTDFTKVIGETVAMGMDNDCTAATAGSIVGAVVGKQGIPEHWYRNFNNKIHSYLIDNRYFSISGVLNRFEKQARKVHSQQRVAQRRGKSRA